MGPQRITIKNICFPNYLFGAIIIFQNRFLPSFLGVAKTRIGKQKGTENGKNTMKFIAWICIIYSFYMNDYYHSLKVALLLDIIRMSYNYKSLHSICLIKYETEKIKFTQSVTKLAIIITFSLFPFCYFVVIIV